MRLIIVFAAVLAVLALKWAWNTNGTVTEDGFASDHEVLIDGEWVPAPGTEATR